MNTLRQLMHKTRKVGASGLVALVSLNLAMMSLVSPNAMAVPQQNGLDSSKYQDILLAQGTRSRRMIFHLSDRGVPVSRVGGAARGGCRSNTPQLQLTALTPITATGKSALVETISSHPTFFVYLPETSAQKAEFIVEDAKTQNDLHHETLTLTRTGGIVQVKMPAEKVAALELNHQYKWSFTLLCDPEDPSANLFVEGVIQRVEASTDFTKQIQVAKSAEGDQALLYASNGYWFESLQSLAEMRQKSPQDKALLQDWSDLLSSVKLDAIAQEPILINWAEKSPSKNNPTQ